MNHKQTTKTQRRTNRAVRIRKKISGTPERPRISVYRTLRYISAQVVDDHASKTVLALHSKKLGVAGTKTEVAFALGKKLGEMMLEKNLKTAVFDRKGHKFHGRVKALASGVREAGIEM